MPTRMPLRSPRPPVAATRTPASRTRDDKYYSKVIGRALDILGVLRKHEHPLGLAEIGTHVGLAKSSVFRLLHALEVSGYVERSRDEYLSHHFDSDTKFAQTVTRKVVRRNELVGGDVALVTAETESSGAYDGKPVKLIGLETAVLRRVEGQWRIVHVHWSSRKPAP